MRAAIKGLLAAMAALVVSSGAEAACEWDPENLLLMDLEHGQVVIEMRPDLAPNHVARIKELTRAGFYDGSPFHRVIEGFMAQTGSDPADPGGGSGQTIDAEFSGVSHRRGMVSMARLANDPDSADSQFFIVFQDSAFLDGQYTVWGEVCAGMEFVDKIKRGDPDDNGMVAQDPDVIERMQVLADLIAADGEG